MKYDKSGLVVLKSYNGRPSLFIELEVDFENHEVKRVQHILTWLVLGYTEEIDLWLQMPLTLDEANQLVDSGPILVDSFIAERPGRVITLVTHRGSQKSIDSFAMTVPDQANGILWMVEAMIAHLQAKRKSLQLAIEKHQPLTYGAVFDPRAVFNSRLVPRGEVKKQLVVIDRVLAQVA